MPVIPMVRKKIEKKSKKILKFFLTKGITGMQTHYFGFTLLTHVYLVKQNIAKLNIEYNEAS